MASLTLGQPTGPGGDAGDNGHNQNSIFSSFEQKMPKLAIAPGTSRKPRIKSSSKSTSAQQPPNFWEVDDIMALTKFAKDALAALIQNSSLACQMPQDEETFQLGNEADVVRASTLYLVYPVNIVLTQHCKPRQISINCKSEFHPIDPQYAVTKAGTSKAGPSKDPDDASQDSRCDIVWEFVMPGQKPVLFAAVEFKRQFVLRGDQFEKAKKSDREGSSFDGNSMIVLKQVAKYAKKNLQDILVYDWNYMFVAFLDPHDESARDSNGDS